jgi:hypothetical protein
MSPTPQPVLSEIDLIGTRWHNNIALLSGALTSLVTSFALAKLGEIAVNRLSPDNCSTLKSVIILSGSFVVGVAAGHCVTAGLVGLVASSAMAKLAISLTFNTIGSLAGIGLYYSTQGHLFNPC